MNMQTSLPVLLDALPPDSTHPPQTGFSRDKQVAFISALANSGAARRAVRAAGISHQSAYRMRRANPAFRLAWDAPIPLPRISKPRSSASPGGRNSRRSTGRA